MKRLIPLLALATLAAPGALAQSLFVSPDVPTSPDGVDFLPWEVVRHAAGAYALELGVPGDPAIDALHKLDQPGVWLLSVEAPNDLGGALPAPALPHDVVRLDMASDSYSLFFCGASVGGAVPLESDVDALYLDGGDAGDLIVSFDVPTTIGAMTFQPSALVRYTRTGPGCGGWSLVGLEIDLAAVADDYSPAAANLIGAARGGGLLLFTLDIPTDLAPTAGPTTYLPGHVVSWDGAKFDLYEDLQTSGAPGWPLSSRLVGLARQASPGRVPVTLRLGRSTMTPGDIVLTWAASCSSGAEDYGIYEGTIGNWYDHASIDCTDDGANLTEEVSPAPTSNYYLVVPHNLDDEGSYGVDSTPAERPQAAAPADRCVVTQAVTPCPP